jgi:hypothetical protein
MTMACGLVLVTAAPPSRVNFMDVLNKKFLAPSRQGAKKNA